ncbi:MAG: Asp-tRNA(Asn)/Glu-tRNA(Gln) amidotransferase subunit GatB [Candidatus Harrisonbacteria bacterium CG10_big_fil_rev_8_21_14_0_10_42_17]|uniref:Aspartyl/glutamyl-tRNA(Asn/Gln) amidotransferase subunit B n=1 Tax=Candidatus Harrisonbacteria bacterium CG10_big_fil_rev_8_21_14_0_10_42_17 TaxID=1974584 RepID=A0A2M6WGU0_9BACT|nr:MAG: Asp-tRNA(Asn)/Glu-tRNA(Gln) amidotransferase subunit GatB [Candidatus Harrisonbacteria bacterium CG10_big_fil_rev_8_21_14_0_10_42_17]
MKNYKPTIGLETHAELKTETKMFCDSKNDPDEVVPNTNVCPICLGHPGTLPTINKKAVEAVLKVGMALGGDIPAHSKFDRKNYFYPDLPKAYQISQYDLPLVFGGMLNGVRITRVHLEEDTGRLLHASDGKHSLVDFNRAGVPLMELVTEPNIASAEEIVKFGKELQLMLRYLGVSDADMEKGQMRVEVNISLGKMLNDELKMGTKVEIKNINSFKAAHDATIYEIQRQTEVLERGEKVIQETRGWDENRKKTVSQRSKEEAHDYRYFSEPDLPPIDLTKIDLTKLQHEIPEMPKAKRVRFKTQYGLSDDQTELLVGNRAIAEFFEEACSELRSEDNKNIPEETFLLYNYLTSDIAGMMAKEKISFTGLKITPKNLADVVELISHNKVSSRGAKDLLAKMLDEGGDPHEIMKNERMEQVSDEETLKKVIQKIITDNPQPVGDFKAGKGKALKFLVGQAMKELKGAGNPQLLEKLLKEELI